MYIRKSIKELLYNIFDFTQREMDFFTFKKTSQIMLTEIQHQVNTSFVSIIGSSCRKDVIITAMVSLCVVRVTFGMTYFNQIDDVFVFY